MAGAFTHFIISEQAKNKRSKLGSELWRLLNKHSEFMYLGAVSPDLPYLSFKTGKVNWADVMHYDQTNSICITGHNALKENWVSKKTADEIKFVWLMGYASHLVADATIHPIVEAIVGPYEENSEEHRICEMTQDSLIFYDYKRNDITYAEFSSILKSCKKSDSFSDLMNFWKNNIIRNYSDIDEEPNPSLWFNTYTKAIDVAEGGSNTVAFFRHAGIGGEFLYSPCKVVRSEYPKRYDKYYAKAKLPSSSTGEFKKEGFEKSVTNVTDAWVKLYEGLTSGVDVSQVVKNWNLDTGIDMDSPNNEKTYWVA